MANQAFESWRYVAEMTQPTRRRADQSVPELAEQLGVSPSLVFQWGEPDGRRLHADMIPALTEATGDTLLVEWLNEACGLVAVAAPGGPVDAAAIGQALKEFGAFIATMASAIEDGRVTRTEMDRISREGWEVLCCVVGLMEAARESMRARRPDGRARTLRETA